MGGVNYPGSYCINHSIQINARIYFEVCCFWYILTQLRDHVSKEQCSYGEYAKKQGPGRRKFIGGGAVWGIERGGGLDRGNVWGCQKKNTRPGPLTGVGWGIGAWARRLWGPRGLVNNSTRSLDCTASVTAGNAFDQSL